MKHNILIMGEINTGKTTSLRTLLPRYWDDRDTEHRGAGLTPFIISLEPGIVTSLSPNLCTPVPTDGPDHRIHWHYLPPRRSDWLDVRNFAKLANTLSIENLTKIDDPRRGTYTEFMDLFSLCHNYTCHGCGAEFGDVSQWGEDRALAIDSLTGLTTIARTNLCGGSPFLSLPKIGGIQGLIEAFLDLFWGNTRCTAILLAHIEREASPTTGLSYLALSTIGQKLAPKLTKKPDEGLLATHEGKRYKWSNLEPSMELKRRQLPPSADLPQDFTLLYKGH